MSLVATLPENSLLSTGSTMLNLALTGFPYGGFAKGYYFFFVGDSRSGKTFFTLTCLAEAAQNPEFDDYYFVYDCPEEGALMNMADYFGSTMSERLENPMGPNKHSQSTEQFYANLNEWLGEGPVIYILDSMDALSGSDAGGGYGTGKAKDNSRNFPSMISKLKETGSILIVISQTRDNIGFGAQYKPKTRGGGHALEFYATAEIWTKVGIPVTKTYKEKKRRIGSNILLQVKKNRLTGKDRSVTVPIMQQYGIDDVNSMIDFLLSEKYATKSKQSIKIPSMDFSGSRANLIDHIDESGPALLVDTVHSAWLEIEEAITPKRRKRYS